MVIKNVLQEIVTPINMLSQGHNYLLMSGINKEPEKADLEYKDWKNYCYITPKKREKNQGFSLKEVWPILHCCCLILLQFIRKIN